MEDRFLVTKAVLECYPYIDDMYDALTRSADKCVADGFYAIFAEEQMRLYEQIMKYNDRKVGLYNLKYIIEKGMNGSNEVFRARYLQGKSASEIAVQGGGKLRTIYRQLQKGLATFTFTLELMGFNKKRLLKEFGNEPLFSSMLKRVIEEDDEAARMRKECKKVNTEAFRELSPRNNHRHSHPRQDSDDRVYA